MVELICGEDKKKFPVKQAQDILYIQKQMRLKGWELPCDSPYEFKDNALIKRENTGNCKGATSAKGDSGGRGSPKKAKVSQRDDSENSEPE